MSRIQIQDPPKSNQFDEGLKFKQDPPKSNQTYDAYKKGNQIWYSCPHCRRKHYHGWIDGEREAYRVSHCSKNFDNVVLNVQQ